MPRWIVRGFALLLIGCIVVAVAVAGRVWLVAQDAPRHLERRGVLISAEQTGRLRLAHSEIREYRLVSDSGLRVDIAVRFPDRILPQRPLLLIMGGQETGRAAVEVIPDTRGVVLAAISYPFGTVPHRNLLAVFAALPRIQRGIFDTPAAALLALDYLLGTEAGISPERVEMAGISFGAYLAAVPAVLDRRVQRLWLIHGGAMPAEVLDYGLRKRVTPAPLRRMVARFLADVVGATHLGPEAWLGRLSPRPLVLVHAAEDSALPATAVEALRKLAGQPYEELWTAGEHVHPRRPQVISAISDLMFTRVACPLIDSERC